MLTFQKTQFDVMKMKSKWRKVENVMKFINLSKKAVKKTIEGDVDVEKIARSVSKWTLLKNSITFMTRIKSVTKNSMEMAGSKVSLSNRKFIRFLLIW